MDAKLEAAYNAQITMEYGSAYHYLAMGAWLESEGLPGMASWMQLQADEETAHAKRFYQFVLDRGGRVNLGPIAAPDAVFEKPIDVFRRSLEQERAVTASINELYALAVDTKDFASIPLLDWFVNEQVEEEATVQQVIDDLERGGDVGHSILMIDRELGARQPGVE